MSKYKIIRLGPFKFSLKEALLFLIALGLIIYIIFFTKPISPIAPTQFFLKGHAYVIDGDSIRIEGTETRMRGIDAPELHQFCCYNKEKIPCGKLAKNHLLKMLKNQNITCSYEGLDKYQRALAMCFVGDININRQMVLDGYAVSYYDYREEENYAKHNQKGIWAFDFMRPNKWRRLHPFTKNSIQNP